MILTPENYAHAGERFGIIRKMQGLSQRQLSLKAGVSSACVSALEAGTNRGQLATFVLIADALGLEIEIREKIEL